MKGRMFNMVWINFSSETGLTKSQWDWVPIAKPDLTVSIEHYLGQASLPFPSVPWLCFGLATTPGRLLIFPLTKSSLVLKDGYWRWNLVCVLGWALNLPRAFTLPLVCHLTVQWTALRHVPHLPAFWWLSSLLPGAPGINGGVWKR
jgi:hypothetical protein